MLRNILVRSTRVHGVSGIKWISSVLSATILYGVHTHIYCIYIHERAIHYTEITSGPHHVFFFLGILEVKFKWFSGVICLSSPAYKLITPGPGSTELLFVSTNTLCVTHFRRDTRP